MLGGMELKLKFMIIMIPRIFKFHFHSKSNKFPVMVLLELLIHK